MAKSSIKELNLRARLIRREAAKLRALPNLLPIVRQFLDDCERELTRVEVVKRGLLAKRQPGARR